MVFPPPKGVDLNDPDQLGAIMSEIPLGAKIAVLVAWGLGTFGGGLVGVFLSGRKAWPATVVALVITGFSWLLATRFAKSEDA